MKFKNLNTLNMINKALYKPYQTQTEFSDVTSTILMPAIFFIVTKTPEQFLKTLPLQVLSSSLLGMYCDFVHKQGLSSYRQDFANEYSQYEIVEQDNALFVNVTQPSFSSANGEFDFDYVSQNKIDYDYKLNVVGIVLSLATLVPYCYSMQREKYFYNNIIRAVYAAWYCAKIGSLVDLSYQEQEKLYNIHKFDDMSVELNYLDPLHMQLYSDYYSQ